MMILSRAIRRGDRTKRTRGYGVAICYMQAVALGSSLAMALVPLQASPALATNDAAQTRTFVAAQYQLIRLIDVKLTSGLTSIDELVKLVRRGCSSVGSGAPPSALAQAQELVHEIGGTLLVKLLRNDRHVILRFVHSVTPLHWSANKLTNTVKAEAVKLEQFSNFPIPDLCVDARAWAASHFEILPTRVEQFDQELTANGSGLQQNNLRLVQPYEDSMTRVLARRARALQKRFERRERKNALGAFFALIRAIFPGKCTPGKLCLPFQVLTPGDLEHGQISA